ncbi:D-erythrulose kinase [Phyllobacterium phragmitis]|uniref:D-erythrulose kinase n=1 Tax=Phyllobacterium phragmitis TaxID=2670329 RepID=A0A2S9IW97_9HYPH|nr:dihydroxyacetone kinase family protein [Phyllobacterium phragmitis]PRD44801.1 D-erythrulose kinase [Phyllobacterium phragmitis]
MTKILNDAEDFATTALAGFANVYSRYVHLVRGGVIRSTRVPRGKVSVIVGGGSGHYPAFAGYVGPGMADAAVAGEIFASPSTAAIARVCRKAEQGGGILLGFGNYAGDVLNFGVAAERLRAEGIDVRIVTVTDDVASAPADRQIQRRGIAGDFMVFKIAGAVAEAGMSLAEVEYVTRHANARTMSLGVAFGGCTLPGSKEPLFTIPTGRMAVGLGIHGEPGIQERGLVSATELSTLLVDTLLKERPAGGKQAAVLLNGLGATKYEELFVLWNIVEKTLGSHDVEIVGAEVGEFVTSLDMQGCSLTIMWLDDELERLWLAPCDTPIFRRGETFPTERIDAAPKDEDEAPIYPPSSEASKRDATCLAVLFDAIVDALENAEQELGLMDAHAGDGDHGQGMRRGATAAKEAFHTAVASGAGAKSALAAAGDAWADRAGGTSGAIWGLLLRSWSGALSDADRLNASVIAKGARAAADDVTRIGGAKIGDKTLVDALVPFVDALEKNLSEGQPLSKAWSAAATVAQAAAEATAPLSPRLGRARPLAERSIGHPDPGAISLALIAKNIATRLSK